MNISPPQLLNPDVYVSGDVTIDPSATLAPGVILQAATDSQLRIAAGVCVGRGVIIQAYHGILEIEAGVVLGSGVLILGAGTLGENACIGSETTIFESSIAPQQVVAARSVIGDRSGELEPEQVSVPPEPPLTPSPPILSGFGELSDPLLELDSFPSEPQIISALEEKPAQPSDVLSVPAEPEPAIAPSPEKSEESALVPQSPESVELSPQPLPPIIYGKEHLSQLLDTLLPHRKAFNNPPN
ncbi:carbon dioxide concentrating mechanism protein [Planktothrix mougeotii]|uniref:Carbon dioxide concentrating mechanism protein n=1 Tax=Planktothrix mougeotii LEGE 06226 TaxID=1828728 RepID=A0ABR9UA11_9CYAN|nr:carbon dioxide concentrating mechanism protein [Planktothrix mougeotii]MBE9142681.1 carbon dioxide concentrating mechanism protein [Planktothrix mougeotii LEGE 06226]